MKLNEKTFNEIKGVLLKKLYNMDCWGKHHVCEHNLQKGFPPDRRGLVIDVAYELRKQGFLVMRPSGHDRQWYLNGAKRQEIKDIVKPNPLPLSSPRLN